VVINDGFAIAYDAPADRWPTLYGAEEGCCRNSPLNRVHHSVDYDPVNGRLVVYGGTYGTEGGLVKADDVWAFDLATEGGWSSCLGASHPPEAPASPYPGA